MYTNDRGVILQVPMVSEKKKSTFFADSNFNRWPNTVRERCSGELTTGSSRDNAEELVRRRCSRVPRA